MQTGPVDGQVLLQDGAMPYSQPSAQEAGTIAFLCSAEVESCPNLGHVRHPRKSTEKGS